jgi:hypothetical protein
VIPEPVREYGALVAYLLGELDEEQQEQVEVRFMTQERYSELRAEVEWDLVDAYIAGTLTSAQRHSFETRYLITPERRKLVEAAWLVRVFRERVAQRAVIWEPAPRRSLVPGFLKRTWLVPALAGAMLAMGAAQLWRPIERYLRPEKRTPSPVKVLPREVAKATPPAPKAPVKKRPPAAPPALVVPAGTPIVVRTLVPLGESEPDVTRRFAARLDQPLGAHGANILPVGTDATVELSVGKLIPSPTENGVRLNVVDLPVTVTSLQIRGQDIPVQVRTVKRRILCEPGADTSSVESCVGPAGSIVGYGLHLLTASPVTIGGVSSGPIPGNQPKQPAVIRSGMTPDQVIAILGQPSQALYTGNKVVYQFKDLKVTFIDGKVSQVE